jgi:hypothetical protein
MAYPTSPVIPGFDLEEVLYAKDQPQYQPLPVYKFDDGTIISRWKLSWKERLLVLFKGDIYLWIMTFNKPLQPIIINVNKPELEIDTE